MKPLSLKGCLCVWKYQGPIRKAIIVMKYKYAYEVGEVIAGKAVSNLLTKDIIKNKNESVLIPIPAHKKRRKVRGFNQTEVIGEMIAKKMRWQYKNNVLVKNRLTIPQASLERKKRLRNQKGSFKTVGLKGIGKDKQVFLFDDVWTTGATIKEAAKVLKRNGLKNVWGLTIVKT